uniref:Polar amino acid transport system ATP-binding protein n=1 Tax=Candidatus Kentrum sp. LPFa TaxID=2126335 RepID=A0A450WD61_9GAMM|nr:MAG: polar amino acid transport system ATP-binding protein [Candidatus Kentron sp. LPFa]
MTNEYRIRISNNLEHRWSDGAAKITVADEIRIHGGNRVAILGPSVSGKTTLLRILGALDRPDSGKIEYRLPGRWPVVWSKKNFSVGNLRRNFGFVFQDARLIPYLNVFENTLSAPLSRGDTGRGGTKKQRKKILSLMKKVGLDITKDLEEDSSQNRNFLERSVLRIGNPNSGRRFLRRYPDNLSGGEKRRIALLRALLADPLVLFADEPTSGVDRETASIVMNTLTEWAHNVSEGRLLVFVTHSPREALEHADRWLVFANAEGESHHYRLEKRDREFIEKQVERQRNRLEHSLQHFGNTS